MVKMGTSVWVSDEVRVRFGLGLGLELRFG